VSCLHEEVVARGQREAGNDVYELARQVRQVGLAEDALVPAAGLRDLAERRAPDLGLLSTLCLWQVRLRRRDDPGRTKDTPGLLELC
jgi:hypothetical protein